MSIADLKKPSGCSVIPNEMGVYVIVRESTVPPVFLERSIGGYFKGKDPTLPVDELRRNWISNMHVIYIGKAGGLSSAATLRSRLKQYMDFGCGKPIGHQGGRMIWQLADSDELIVGWKPLSGVEPVSR